MRIAKNSLTYEVEPGFSIHDGQDYWDLVNAGLWEPETFDIMKKYLSATHSYIDIGAWVGPTVLFGAQLSKKCYAIEPDPVACNGLIQNLSLNPAISNVHVTNIAIAAATGSVEIGARITQGDGMSSMLWAQGTWTVPSFTLKDYVEANKVDDCNFIKMDIEGGEAFVLATCREFFREFHPTLYLSLHTPWIEDKVLFFDMINETLSVYKRILNSNGQALSANDLVKNMDFTTLIATDQ